MRTGKQRGGGGGRRSPRARTTAGKDAVTVHRGGGQGTGCRLLTAHARPPEGTHHSSSFHKCSIRAAMTDTAGGDGNRTGPKEKEGADYCWEEARGITRAYNGQERPD